MKFLVVCDSYLPKTNSAAVQINDLTKAFVSQGHQITLVTTRDINDRVDVRNPNIVIKNVPYNSNDTDSFLRKFTVQFTLPFKMYFKLIPSLGKTTIDGIIWYSPSIFLWPLVLLLKWHFKAKAYLILRDIFPEWAFETQVIRSKVIYFALKKYAQIQYRVADYIGIQAAANASYIPKKFQHRVHLLENWLTDLEQQKASYNFQDPKMAKKHIILYAGNVGIAQGFRRVLNLAEQLKYRDDIIFACFSRGSELESVRSEIKARNIKNIHFFDVVDQAQLAAVCSQCVAGIVALDPRHLTHNIPGKFIMYLRSALPIIALVNENNELIEIIEKNRVGVVLKASDETHWHNLVTNFLNMSVSTSAISNNCVMLFKKRYQSGAAVKTIVSKFKCREEFR